MDATFYDGVTLAPITAQDAPTVADGRYGWLDLDLSSPGAPATAKSLLESLGLDDRQRDLLLKPNRSAKVHVEDEFVDCVVWLGATVDGGPPPEVHLSWTSTRLITVRWGGGDQMNLIRRQIAARAAHLFADPEAFLGVVLLLINSSVDRRLTQLDLELNDIDDAIVAGQAKPQLTRLRSLRGEVSSLQLRYGALDDVAGSILVDPSALPGMTNAVVQIMQGYGTHVRDTYHHIRELADGARGALADYQTSVSDKQGDRINQLTIVSVLFLPISFLTGYFGMNFDWLDDQIMSSVSYLIWGVVVPVVVVVLSLLALREFGFLGRRRRRAQQTPGASVVADVGMVPTPRPVTQKTSAAFPEHLEHVLSRSRPAPAPSNGSAGTAPQPVPATPTAPAEPTPVPATPTTPATPPSPAPSASETGVPAPAGPTA